jgi:hypothetical protein
LDYAVWRRPAHNNGLDEPNAQAKGATIELARINHAASWEFLNPTRLLVWLWRNLGEHDSWAYAAEHPEYP